MADASATPPTFAGERIQDLDIATELRQSYLKYAMSVIVDRALPDVRDGLKPSQRRILVAMNDLHLSPGRKTVKCAKVVGDTMGNYHPHGESVIYPTLVRMAQPFSMSEPLVEGQGNFGSLDRDPPASMRYTECRMTHAAMAMLEDIDKETVDFRPNYDGSRLEPTVLPGAFPNLLVNGGSGIAVAMASNIPPHNASEVARAIALVLDQPEVTTADIMQVLPGPDFPTGARLCGRQAIFEAYETGRATLEMRAVCEIVESKKGGHRIVVAEIPYGVNKASLVEKIADLVKTDRIQGISDIREESAKDVRIVITLKRDADPDVVLNQLYKYSPLRETLGVMMIVLVDGRPVQCSLKRLIEEHIRHRKAVIVRRTRHLLRKAEERHHLVDGLLKALDLIDEIVALIRSSADPSAARAALVGRFAFSLLQAEAILQMRLQRLTNLQRRELETEGEELQRRIADYRDLLARPDRVADALRAEVGQIAERFPRARRTRIEDSQQDVTSLDLVASEHMVVTLTHEGYVKRTQLLNYRTQRRGGKGIIGGESKEGDFIEHLLVADTRDHLLVFTDRGKVYREYVFAVPELGRYAQGRALVNFLEIEASERVMAVLPVPDLSGRGHLFFATREGWVKRTVLPEYRNIRRTGLIAVDLRENDALIGTALVEDQDDVMLLTARGMCIRFAASEVRPMGRSARGVRGIRLRPQDRVVDMVVIRHAGTPAGAGRDTVLTVFEGGYAKRTAFSEYRPQKRGGLGLRNTSDQGLERNGRVVAARAVEDGDVIILITEGGQTIRMSVAEEQFRRLGRSTAGVRAIDLPDGDRLVSMAWVRPEEEDEAGPQVGDEAAEGSAEAGDSG